MNDAVDRINRNYDNGTVNLGYLACPCTQEGKLVAASPLKVTLYPNPASSYINIAVEQGNEQVAVEVYTVTGQLVFFKSYSLETLEAQHIRLDIDNLKSGMYFVRVNSGNESVVKNLIVE